MAGPLPPTQQDAADLQRLIRYVERWRLAHFQRADSEAPARSDQANGFGRARRGRRSGDPRIADADALLQKMRHGLQLALEGGAAMASFGGPRAQSGYAF
jgi:hypothetical protein